MYYSKITLLNSAHAHLINYPTAVYLSYAWNVGSLLGFIIVIQVTSGLMLSFFYSSTCTCTFITVELILRLITYGWLIRFIHTNGSSVLFLFIYMHIVRSIYYGCFKIYYVSIWWSGLLLFLVFMATAFLGYVLPWGQMSSTVI